MNVSIKSEEVKYEVVIAKGVNKTLIHPMLVGFAVQFRGDNHYVIRLLMFPNNPYYLTKNRDSLMDYTVFAKIVKDATTGAVRFQNPVGSANLLSDLKSHLEIRFPLLGTTVFMNLFPRS